MITVACLLWGDFPHGEDYVYKLRDRMTNNLTHDFRFVCFSDREIEGVETLPLTPTWQWNLNKLALYRPDNGLQGRVLALDLDVVPVGNMDDFAAYDGSFAVCESFGEPGKCGGSILSFEAGQMDWLYEKVKQNPPFWAKAAKGGSERMLYRLALKECDFWQRLLPGQIASYKWHCRQGIPEGTRIVVCHGRPRPHEIGLL